MLGITLCVAHAAQYRAIILVGTGLFGPSLQNIVVFLSALMGCPKAPRSGLKRIRMRTPYPVMSCFPVRLVAWTLSWVTPRELNPVDRLIVSHRRLDRLNQEPLRKLLQMP